MPRRAPRAVAAEPAYPQCVRQLTARKDTRFRHFFLCDGCSDRWSADAFDGNAPLHVAERVTGYCLLCNQLRDDIRLRTWFLCDICDRVARSIGRNHVAEKGIMEFWAREVRPRFPGLRLVQNDPSELRPLRPGGKAGVAPVDFHVMDGTERPAFVIENKTGRSSIAGMSQFQLDVSDCDCILNEMRSLNVPAYVIHAQVLELWDKPPTMGFRLAGLWWSDVYAMAENFTGIKSRRDEMRGAAYFRRAAFKPIETFTDGLMGHKGFALVERFNREGVPAMYRRPE